MFVEPRVLYSLFTFCECNFCCSGGLGQGVNNIRSQNNSFRIPADVLRLSCTHINVPFVLLIKVCFDSSPCLPFLFFSPLTVNWSSGFSIMRVRKPQRSHAGFQSWVFVEVHCKMSCWAVSLMSLGWISRKRRNGLLVVRSFCLVAAGVISCFWESGSWVAAGGALQWSQWGAEPGAGWGPAAKHIARQVPSMCVGQGTGQQGTALQ